MFMLTYRFRNFDVIEKKNMCISREQVDQDG